MRAGLAMIRNAAGSTSRSVRACSPVRGIVPVLCEDCRAGDREHDHDAEPPILLNMRAIADMSESAEPSNR